MHKAIKTVNIDGNPLKTIRRPIIEKGTDAILKHLRDKYVEERDSRLGNGDGVGRDAVL